MDCSRQVFVDLSENGASAHVPTPPKDTKGMDMKGIKDMDMKDSGQGKKR